MKLEIDYQDMHVSRKEINEKVGDGMAWHGMAWHVIGRDETRGEEGGEERGEERRRDEIR